MLDLEPILKPIRYLDSQILRQYTKLTKKWEDKGRSKYSLATGIAIPAWLACSYPHELIYTGGVGPTLRWCDIYSGIEGLMLGNHPTGIVESGEKKIINDKVDYFIHSLLNTIRTPLFVFGSSYLAKAGINLYNYLANNDHASLAESIGDIQVGASALGFASSIYIKNSDPKLLEKGPVWKKVIKWCRDNVSELLPQPTPEPAPVKTYSTCLPNEWLLYQE